MKLIVESSDSFVPQLVTVGRNLAKIDQIKGALDCSNLTWVTPVSILPLAARIYEKRILVADKAPYLNTISFPSGIDDPDLLPHGKTYLPIMRFPTNSEALIEKITTGFIRLVLRHIGFGNLITNAFFYAVDEMVTNVWEHSLSKWGWVFVQYFKSKGFLDVVILDQGRGLKKAYEEAFGRSFSDKEAISKALEGDSIKKDKERGYGLRTTRKLVTQSKLNGKFIIIIISGTNGHFAEKGRDLFFDLETWEWKGTIIVMRLYKVTETINYVDYVE